MVANMEIKGRVHLFFEQSGTFKNEFIGLGYEAFDYDIQNNFGETDYTDDLFKAIEDAYEGKPSLFDNISMEALRDKIEGLKDELKKMCDGNI